MSGLERAKLRAMLFEGIGGRRFTQDTPILPDVWMAYGLAPEQPQDLLLTPAREAKAGEVARNLRTAVNDFRAGRRRARHERREEARIAHMPGLIAANLYFDELIRIILPMTGWWSAQIRDLCVALGRAPTAPGVFLLNDEDIERIGARIDELADGPRPAGVIFLREEVSPDFLWMVALVGSIEITRQAGDGTKSKGNGGTGGLAQARAFQALFAGLTADAADKKKTGRPPVGGFIWQIALNRPTEAAVMQSALAVKADAARLLFNLSCKKITWAVLDSGIDSSHPAFRDWDAKPGPDGAIPSRVIRTYDFTQVRDLLDPAATAALFRKTDLDERQRELKERLIRNLENAGVSKPDDEAPRLVRQLQLRLNEGLEIDWSLLEPLLLVAAPPPPPNGHGTHVAGILGADWRPNDDQDPQLRMQGICPDIRLIDMRVLGDDSRIREFEVIAALQFIGYLNRRADARLVHGANLSLSTPHEVTNHACGSTPVCEACNRLWSSGVVLVAAAGNRGHQRYQLASGDELGGYHPISITDPGNAEGIITVGATHCKAHQYGVSYFSSRGPTGDGRRKPDLVAPGEKIHGPMPNNARGIGVGTSCAAPHVSGAAAMLMARFEEMIGRPDRIKQVLCGTATDLGREPYFQGAGMLDILRALQSV